MYHQRFTANTVYARRQRQALHQHIQLGHTLGIRLQSWQVARMMGYAGMKTVVMAVRVEMPACTGRIRCRAITFFMHMKAVLCPWLEATDLPLQAHTLRHLRQLHLAYCRVSLGRLQ